MFRLSILRSNKNCQRINSDDGIRDPMMKDNQRVILVLFYSAFDLSRYRYRINVIADLLFFARSHLASKRYDKAW